MHRFSFLVLALVAMTASAADKSPARRLELADLGTEIGLSKHSLSPDGKRIVVVTQRTDFTDNRYLKTLTLVDVASGALSTLAPERQQVDSPQWSPNGDRIAWLDTASDGLAQIQVAQLDGNPASVRRVTNVEQGVKSFKWSPDGKSFAFIAADPPEERTGDERHNRSFEAGEYDYLATSPPTPSHLWVVPVVGGEPRRITSGMETVMDIEWLRDGKEIAIVTQPTPILVDYIDETLKVLSLDGKQSRTLVHEGKSIVMDTPLKLSPDGRLLSFSRPRGDGRETDFFPENISVIPVAGGERRDATPDLDRDIIAVTWLPDSSGLLAAAPERTLMNLWHQPLGGKPRALDVGAASTVWEVSMSRNGTISFIGSEPNHLPEIYVKASLDAKPRRLTKFHAHLEGLEYGVVQTIRWKNDGFDQDGVLLYPPGFRKGMKAPLVLNIHGGPSQPSAEGWHWSDDGLSRVMAAKGWIVFLPNYRGSGSMGLKYQSAVVDDAGAGPGRDVMAGVAAVKALGVVDEERIALTGYSYGGYMTVWLAGNYPDVWRVAVAGAAVTDNFDWYNLADYNITWGLGMKGSPWVGDNDANYWRQSPITYAKNIRAPMLILSGTHDRRVTITQSYKLYHALKDNGVPVKFIAYPDSPHWPDKPVHERDMFRRWIDWVEQHFRGSSTK